MTTLIIFLCVAYFLPLAIVGSMNWASYTDAKKTGEDISTEEKVMRLYILPLCPVVNALVAIGIIADYFGL